MIVVPLGYGNFPPSFCTNFASDTRFRSSHRDEEGWDKDRGQDGKKNIICGCVQEMFYGCVQEIDVKSESREES